MQRNVGLWAASRTARRPTHDVPEHGAHTIRAVDSEPTRFAKAETAPSRVARIAWLDAARTYCALAILGIHWLRACYRVHLLGESASTSLIMDYHSNDGGLGLLPHILIVEPSLNLATWLLSLVGLFGIFGWEAVSAFIILSGFSLALGSTRGRLTLEQFPMWFARRARRILSPFYLVAFVFLSCYFAISMIAGRSHGTLAREFLAKLGSVLPTPTLGIISSHTLLFDPFQRQGIATFFAPAWWFVPAILVAYLLFPLFDRATRYAKGVPVLAGTALITALSYQLADRGVLLNESWYYIVLQEAFNFSLGIVAGNLWLSDRRLITQRVLGSKYSIPVALMLFSLGTSANWSAATRPIASILYGPGLVILVASGARLTESFWLTRRAAQTDAYNLYLVHQPFAFPIALVSAPLFHGYAVFVGWIIFVGVSVGAGNALATTMRRLGAAARHWNFG